MSTINIYSLKRFLCLFFVCAVGMSLIGSSFISCTPGIDDLASTGDDDDDENRTRRDRSSDDDDDDDDEGDECKGDETCERICAQIYKTFQEKIECMEKGDVKVAKLEKVHDLLMEDFDDAVDLKSNLEEISEGDDVDRDDFGDYLEIGGIKWIEAIKNGLLGNTASADITPEKIRNRLIKTLEWFIDDDNERAAKILSSADDGDDILEELILKLFEVKGSSDTCMSGSTAVAPASGDSSADLWELLDDDLQIGYHYKSEGAVRTVSLKSKRTKLYDALSCLYSDIGSGDQSIFSEAANKDNEVIFDMAFDLLNKVCEDLYREPTLNENVVCRRALFCWVDEKKQEGSPGHFIRDDFVENKESQLEVSGGQSQYDGCRAQDVWEFFIRED